MQSLPFSARRIEEAALNAWPALNTQIYDGWILRFANGYTKRANSVTPLFAGVEDIGVNEKISYCEMVYERQNLPAVFRLPTLLDIEALDEQLAAKNYSKIDSTQVQALDLRGRSFHFAPNMTILEGKAGLRIWLNAFHELNKEREDGQTHEKMLDNIIGLTGAMVMTVGKEIVACGLGVVEGPYLGLFDIVTAVDQRRKGYGTMLTQSLLAWGKRSAARVAYLQVMENNKLAKGLYSRLGFQERYRYWYRVGP